MMKTAIFCIFFSCTSALTINDKAIPKEGIAQSNHSLQMKQKVEVQAMDGATMNAKVHSISEKVRLQAPPKLWHKLETSGLVELALRVFNDTEFVKVALKHRNYKNEHAGSVLQTALQKNELPDSEKMFPSGLDPEMKEMSQAVRAALGRQISEREWQETKKSLSLIQAEGPDSAFATNNPKMLYALMLPFVISAFGAGGHPEISYFIASTCTTYVLCALTGAISSSAKLEEYGLGDMTLPFQAKVPEIPNFEFAPFLKAVFIDKVMTGGACLPYQVWGEIDRKGGINHAAVNAFGSAISNLANKREALTNRGKEAYKKFVNS